METIGYLAALLIGISLGLIGGGGSILTVPTLVYLMGLNPVIATAYSLFIVGITSLAGSFRFYRKGLVSLKTAAVFGVPSILSVYATRRYVVPTLPEIICSIGSFEVTRDILLMLLFACLMVFASVSMIRQDQKPKISVDENIDTTVLKGAARVGTNINPSFNFAAILAEGALVGVFTGLVGAGGGFLIIPALVLFSKLDMKRAVGTSLLIIAAKSLLGFLGDVANYEIDWAFLGIFSSLSIAGIFLGTILSGKIPAEKLKSGFGWFVLAMGIYILVRELLF
ncbi:MAG: sulfite exporter TauE/SafE family protein [Rufibacter sp.]